LVAQRALEQLADAASSFLVILDPRRVPERGIMPDVLRVQAGELGDPVALVVAAEADHGALHAAGAQ